MPTVSPLADSPDHATDPPRAHPGPGRIDTHELPVPAGGSIPVQVWVDPYLAEFGHDARSSYVELFWLGILGPSATWLLRRLAAGLVHHPEGYLLPVVDTSASLGLGRPGGRNSSFVRALHRCCVFGVTRFVDDTLEVRTRVPSLRPKQLRRLPESLQATHAALTTRHPSIGDARTPSSGGPAGP